MSQARDNVQGQLIGMQDRGKAPGEVATARAQQVESSWRPSGGVRGVGWGGIPSLGQEKDDLHDLPCGTCPLNSLSACPSSIDFC